MYFIAVIPPQEIRDAITEFKKDIAVRFQSKAALRIIPHITLKAPFRVPASDHEDLIRWFQNCRVSVPPFQQQIRDFGSFRNGRNPVLFVKPVMNEYLRQLHNEVIQNFSDGYSSEKVLKSETDFHPHITVVYRDLKFSMFKQAWREYSTKQYSATFEVTDFHLLRHDGRVWNSISNFYLQKSVQ